jgi:hypothetical protein
MSMRVKKTLTLPPPKASPAVDVSPDGYPRSKKKECTKKHKATKRTLHKCAALTKTLMHQDDSDPPSDVCVWDPLTGSWLPIVPKKKQCNRRVTIL